MVDRIRKTLRQLSPKEQKHITNAIEQIKANDLKGFDLKKLQGRNDVYRVRKGNFRIIFRRISDVENTIIAIERRTDTTYNEN